MTSIASIDLKIYINSMNSEARKLLSESKNLEARAREIQAQATKLEQEFPQVLKKD